MLLAATLPTLSTHLLVVSLVLCQNLLTHLLFPLVNIRIQFVSVLLDGELLIIVDRNHNLLGTNWLFLGVVELGNIWMLQCLLSSQPFIWVELQQILQKIQCFLRRRRKHVSELLRLRWWQAFQHCLCQRAIDRLDVFLARSSCNLHNSI